MKLRGPVVRLIASISACGVLVAALTSAAWFALGPDLAAGSTFFKIEKVSKAESEFSGAPTKPFFFLALGNDSREAGVNGLGDSIHVIGVNPATKQATMLNVPRDTEAPGGGKINAFHSQGGLPAIVDQLDKMMGIHIDYAITTDFPRFINMVNALGWDRDRPPVRPERRGVLGLRLPAGSPRSRRRPGAGDRARPSRLRSPG